MTDLPPEGRPRPAWMFAEDREALEAAGFTLVESDIGEEPRAPRQHGPRYNLLMAEAAARKREREAGA